MFRGIKTFLRRRLVQNLDGSQKLGIFYESSEVELKTG